MTPDPKLVTGCGYPKLQLSACVVGVTYKEISQRSLHFSVRSETLLLSPPAVLGAAPSRTPAELAAGGCSETGAWPGGDIVCQGHGGDVLCCGRAAKQCPCASPCPAASTA